MKTISISQLNGEERILLIDDEEMVLDVIGQILSRFGYTVTAHNSSIEALKCFKESPYEFDLVITDKTMPEPSGDTLVMEIKKVRPELPVILCTGSSEEIENGRGSAVNPDKILMKPAGKDELLKSIRYLLDN